MADKVPLSFACCPYDHMGALANGELQPDNIDLNFITVEHPRVLFDRMIRGKEFDASEMSSSEYICRYAAGERDLIAIPVFTSRAFRHGFIAINTDVVQKLSDLQGKRVGVQLYTMTAAVWIRGLLHDSGVNLSSITWVEGAIEKPGPHGNPKAKPLCRPVELEPNQDKTRGLGQLLKDGELAATIGAETPSCLGNAPNVQRLFPNLREAEKKYHRDTGIFPIMHLVVIRKEVVDKHPFVPASLYYAMNEAKEIAKQRMRGHGAYRYMLPFLPSDLEEIDELFGGDAWPYGLEPNRKPLETLVGYLYDQGMIEMKVPLEELFALIRSPS